MLITASKFQYLFDLLLEFSYSALIKENKYYYIIKLLYFDNIFQYNLFPLCSYLFNIQKYNFVTESIITNGLRRGYTV